MDAQAKTDNTVQVDAIKRRADDYLIKPKVLCESLVEHIRYVIQRKKGIEALRHNCEYFRSIVENAPCVIICISAQGKILEFNTCAQDLWKQGPDKVTGKSFLKTCVERGDRFNVYVDLRKALAGESVKRTSTTITRADGRCDSLLWDFNPMRTNGERITGVIAAAREHTDAISRNDRHSWALKHAFNTDLDDTVRTILTGLSAILEKIEDIENRADPATLKQLFHNMGPANCRDQNICVRKAAAVERLLLSLITSKAETTS